MKGRKPLYSIPARKRHVRPRHVTVPALGPTVSSALFPAIAAQTYCHKQHHQQESTYTHPRRRHHRLLRHRGGKLRHRDALFHSGKGGIGLRPSNHTQGGHGANCQHQHQQEGKKVFQRLFPHPGTPLSEGPPVTRWLHFDDKCYNLVTF